MILSEAESMAMAWNLKKPFNHQLKSLRKKVERETSPTDDIRQPFAQALTMLRRQYSSSVDGTPQTSGLHGTTVQYLQLPQPRRARYYFWHNKVRYSGYGVPIPEKLWGHDRLLGRTQD